jgi:phosphoglycolate phosphatase
MIKGILFDKDGTLFDFGASWSAWAVALLEDLSGGDRASSVRLASLIGFDLSRGVFLPDSFVISGTSDQIVEALLPGLPGANGAALLQRINRAAAETHMVPAVPLAPLLKVLSDRGLRLGVATNDAEAPARAHLKVAGITDHFEFVAGYDTGHGAKPDAGMCLAFADHLGVAPQDCVMVGDSLHDLHAGRAAGMISVAVLTGMADAATLAPYAEVVLNDIGGLPEWLDARQANNPDHPRQKTTQSVVI